MHWPQVVISSEGSIAQVGYLHPTRFHVEPKQTGMRAARTYVQVCAAHTVCRSVGATSAQVPMLSGGDWHCCKNSSSNGNVGSSNLEHMVCLAQGMRKYQRPEVSVVRSGGHSKYVQEVSGVLPQLLPSKAWGPVCRTATKNISNVSCSMHASRLIQSSR